MGRLVSQYIKTVQIRSNQDSSCRTVNLIFPTMNTLHLNDKSVTRDHCYLCFIVITIIVSIQGKISGRVPVINAFSPESSAGVVRMYMRGCQGLDLQGSGKKYRESNLILQPFWFDKTANTIPIAHSSHSYSSPSPINWSLGILSPNQWDVRHLLYLCSLYISLFPADTSFIDLREDFPLRGREAQSRTR